MEQEEVVVDTAVPDNEGIAPFDWEDLLYETWLEEHLERRKASPPRGSIDLGVGQNRNTSHHQNRRRADARHTLGRISRIARP